MRKAGIAAVLMIGVSLTAGVLKDIPYYEKNAPVCGDVEYRNERCKLDLFLPEKVKKFSTIIYFHGGGLSRGEKGCPGYINRSKCAIVPVNYRLSGKRAKAPDYIYDAAAAVAWVVKNIEKHGGDPSRIYVTGHSAGGYLTAMLALDKKYLNTFGVEPKAIAGYFPVSGQMTTHFRILAERKERGEKVPDLVVDEYAPVFHAGKDAPSMIFFVGDSDYDWPSRVEENALLAARLTRIYKNKDIKIVKIPYGTHGSCAPPSYAAMDLIINPKIKRK